MYVRQEQAMNKSVVVGVYESDVQFVLAASRPLSVEDVDDFIYLLQLVKRQVSRHRPRGYDPITLGC
jgi:hypothetical protein